MDSSYRRLSYETIDIDDNFELDPPSMRNFQAWLNDINTKILESTLYGREEFVSNMMAKYHQSLKDFRFSNKDRSKLRDHILIHIKYFYLYYKELRRSLMDTKYFTLMEDILIFYCNLELKLVQNTEKGLLLTVKRLCKQLGVYLHYKLKHIIHVLLKLEYNIQILQIQTVMRGVYHRILSLPAEPLSDEAFCRFYLAVERYKEVALPQEKKKLVQFAFIKFRQNEDYLQRNFLMKTVLTPPSSSITDIIQDLLDLKTKAINAYFDYLKKNESTELPKVNVNIDMQYNSDRFSKTLNDVLSTFLSTTIMDDKVKPECIDLDSDVEAIEDDGGMLVISDEDDEDKEVSSCSKRKKKKKISCPMRDGDVIQLDSDDDSNPILEVTLTSPVLTETSTSPAATHTTTINTSCLHQGTTTSSAPVPSTSSISLQTNDFSTLLSTTGNASMNVESILQTETSKPTTPDSQNSKISSKETKDSQTQTIDVSVQTTFNISDLSLDFQSPLQEPSHIASDGILDKEQLKQNTPCSIENVPPIMSPPIKIASRDISVSTEITASDSLDIPSLTSLPALSLSGSVLPFSSSNCKMTFSSCGLSPIEKDVTNDRLTNMKTQSFELPEQIKEMRISEMSVSEKEKSHMPMQAAGRILDSLMSNDVSKVLPDNVFKAEQQEKQISEDSVHDTNLPSLSELTSSHSQKIPSKALVTCDNTNASLFSLQASLPKRSSSTIDLHSAKEKSLLNSIQDSKFEHLVQCEDSAKLKVPEIEEHEQLLAVATNQSDLKNIDDKASEPQLSLSKNNCPSKIQTYSPQSVGSTMELSSSKKNFVKPHEDFTNESLPPFVNKFTNETEQIENMESLEDDIMPKLTAESSQPQMTSSVTSTEIQKRVIQDEKRSFDTFLYEQVFQGLPNSVLNSSAHLKKDGTCLPITSTSVPSTDFGLTTTIHQLPEILPPTSTITDKYDTINVPNTKPMNFFNDSKMVYNSLYHLDSKFLSPNCSKVESLGQSHRCTDIVPTISGNQTTLPSSTMSVSTVSTKHISSSLSTSSTYTTMSKSLMATKETLSPIQTNSLDKHDFLLSDLFGCRVDDVLSSLPKPKSSTNKNYLSTDLLSKCDVETSVTVSYVPQNIVIPPLITNALAKNIEKSRNIQSENVSIESPEPLSNVSPNFNSANITSRYMSDIESTSSIGRIALPGESMTPAPSDCPKATGLNVDSNENEFKKLVKKSPESVKYAHGMHTPPSEDLDEDDSRYLNTRLGNNDLRIDSESNKIARSPYSNSKLNSVDFRQRNDSDSDLLDENVLSNNFLWEKILVEKIESGKSSVIPEQDVFTDTGQKYSKSNSPEDEDFHSNLSQKEDDITDSDDRFSVHGPIEEDFRKKVNQMAAIEDYSCIGRDNKFNGLTSSKKYSCKENYLEDTEDNEYDGNTSSTESVDPSQKIKTDLPRKSNRPKTKSKRKSVRFKGLVDGNNGHKSEKVLTSEKHEGLGVFEEPEYITGVEYLFTYANKIPPSIPEIASPPYDKIESKDYKNYLTEEFRGTGEKLNGAEVNLPLKWGLNFSEHIDNYITSKYQKTKKHNKSELRKLKQVPHDDSETFICTAYGKFIEVLRDGIKCNIFPNDDKINEETSVMIEPCPSSQKPKKHNEKNHITVQSCIKKHIETDRNSTMKNDILSKGSSSYDALHENTRNSVKGQIRVINGYTQMSGRQRKVTFEDEEPMPSKRRKLMKRGAVVNLQRT